jgi:hypothetical protein
MLDSLMHFHWGVLGLFGFLGLMIALVVMSGMGIVQDLRRCFGWVPKEEREQEEKSEKETEMIQMLALGEVAEPREETSFGCPPHGPEVALNLDANRYVINSSNDADG